MIEAAPAPTATVRPPVPPARLNRVRFHLLARAFVVLPTSLLGAGLFAVWVSVVAVSPITLVAALVVPVTALVRAYADVHRRDAARITGRPIERPYRDTTGLGLVRRVLTIVRDPASWRDAWWLLAHAVVGCTASALSIAFFAGGLFYSSYPFLYWVTPQSAFGRPFGGLFVLHSVGDAALLMPLALVSFGIWYASCLPLARAELSLTRSLLGPRR
jgi:Putative sensor